jgi:hypothetical protein
MSKMLQLTSNSWLIRANSGTSGLLFKVDPGYLFMSPTTRIEFEDYDAVVKKFGKLSLEQRQDEDEVSHIAGFPVKHEHIVVQSEKPPLYTTGGRQVFAAGYWGLKYPNGWTIAYCPKQKTTVDYESVGPFRNKLELSNHISMLNTQANLSVGQDK